MQLSKNGIIKSDKSTPHGANLPESFWTNYVQVCQRLKVDPVNLAAIIESESGFNPAAQNIQNDNIIAQGLNQITAQVAKALKMPDNIWKSFATLSAENQLPWLEKYFSMNSVAGKTKGQIYRKNFGGFPNPDGSLYASKEYIDNYQPEEDRPKFKNPSFQDMACKQNKPLVYNGRIVQEALDKLVENKPSKLIVAAIEKALNK